MIEKLGIITLAGLLALPQDAFAQVPGGSLRLLGAADRYVAGTAAEASTRPTNASARAASGSGRRRSRGRDVLYYAAFYAGLAVAGVVIYKLRLIHE